MNTIFKVSIIDDDESVWSRAFTGREKAIEFAKAHKYSNITINYL